MKRIVTVVLVVFAATAGALWYGRGTGGGASEATYRTAVADRGTVVAQISTAGAVSPITTVIVGSQLSGQVIEILADFNSEVKTGQVLARLNADQIRARLDGARADLQQAYAARRMLDAQMEKSRADRERAAAVAADMRAQLEKSRTQLEDAEKTLARQVDLGARGIVSTAALQTARTQRDMLLAQTDSARAQIRSSEAQIAALKADAAVIEAQMISADATVQQRGAMVRQVDVDLANTDIRSPVDGVVVQRNVELGQPVAASLQAPTLFLVAQDLRRVQIQANVDEADVGRVREGMEADFTVNAFPGRNFNGVVKQVRLGSQTVQNVVIYTTVIEVDNPNLDLRPGMTANLRIVTERRQDVVRVPNAALRWRPPVAAEEAPPLPLPVQRAPAESDDSAAGPFAGGGGPGGGGGRGGFQPGVFADRIKGALGLDENQKQALDRIVAELPAPGNGRGRGRGLLIEKINGILNETQRTTLEGLLQDWSRGGGGRRRQDARADTGVAGRVYRIGEQGRPQLVTVRLGSSDGTFTEVLSGLSAGASVITGGGPAPSARPGGFRFGM